MAARCRRRSLRSTGRGPIHSTAPKARRRRPAGRTPPLPRQLRSRTSPPRPRRLRPQSPHRRLLNRRTLPRRDPPHRGTLPRRGQPHQPHQLQPNRSLHSRPRHQPHRKTSHLPPRRLPHRPQPHRKAPHLRPQRLPRRQPPRTSRPHQPHCRRWIPWPRRQRANRRMLHLPLRRLPPEIPPRRLRRVVRALHRRLSAPVASIPASPSATGARVIISVRRLLGWHISCTAQTLPATSHSVNGRWIATSSAREPDLSFAGLPISPSTDPRTSPTFHRADSGRCPVGWLCH